MSGDVNSGNRFVLWRCEKDRRWYWKLYPSHSPYGAIAQSVRGYATEVAAMRSIDSACNAFRGAQRGKNGKQRIQLF